MEATYVQNLNSIVADFGAEEIHANYLGGSSSDLFITL